MANKKLQQIGNNGVEEFFEEITFGLGNSFDVASNLPKTDYELINEAMASGVSVVKMGFMMLILQQQEKQIEKVFTLLYGALTLLLSPLGKMGKNYLKRFKGTKLSKMLNFFSSNSSDRIALSRLGVDLAHQQVNSKSSTNSSLDRFSISMDKERNMINEEKLKLNLANSKAQNYSNTLMLKLFSSGFTKKDKQILKKILGKDNVDNVNIDDLNKVSSFMWSKDSKGNMVGLSQEFMNLLNGLGYLHNK